MSATESADVEENGTEPAHTAQAGTRPGQRPTNFGPTLRRMLSEVADQRVRIITGIVLGAVGVVLNAAGPMLLGMATDIVVAGMGTGVDFGALARILALITGVYALGALSVWSQGVLTTVAMQRTLAKLRRKLQHKLSRVPLSYVDARQRGELLSRMTNDVDNLAQTLQQTLSQLITARSEEHTSELQSRGQLVCRLLLERKKARYRGPAR